MKKIKKLLKKYGRIFEFAVIIIACFIIVKGCSNSFSRGEHKVTRERVMATLIPSQDLVALKYSYADIKEEDKDFFKGIKLPFLSDKYLFVVEGKIHLGYNLQNMDVKVDEKNQKIQIHLPEVEIISHEAKIRSMYIIQNSAFVEMKLDESYAKGEEYQKIEEEKIMQDKEILRQTREQAEKTIRNLLMIGEFAKDYEIIFD